jgi:molybdopterin-guanine dinucleotide biosynthesis protein A
VSRQAAAVVLAGGRSTRFGSDKALALFRGEPLLAHVVRAVSARFGEVLVVAKDVRRYASFGAATAPDASPLQTPLAGIEAGLAACASDLVFVCAADMPFAADDPLLDALFARSADRDAVVPVNGGVRQPLCALYRRATCLAAAREVLREGSVGPKRLLDAVRTELLEWVDERPFLDADTPQALAALEHI